MLPSLSIFFYQLLLSLCMFVIRWMLLSLWVFFVIRCCPYHRFPQLDIAFIMNVFFLLSEHYLHQGCFYQLYIALTTDVTFFSWMLPSLWMQLRSSSTVSRKWSPTNMMYSETLWTRGEVKTINGQTMDCFPTRGLPVPWNHGPKIAEAMKGVCIVHIVFYITVSFLWFMHLEPVLLRFNWIELVYFRVILLLYIYIYIIGIIHEGAERRSVLQEAGQTWWPKPKGEFTRYGQAECNTLLCSAPECCFPFITCQLVVLPA